MSEKIDLYSMRDEEISELLLSLGEPKYRVKQI